MSFLVWPPEINSSLMFGGPGPSSLVAAAASWDGLATELDSAAQSFTSITSALTDQAWQGPAAAAMMQTATQYAGFLGEATAQAQAAATQAQAVVSAFESAIAATVHPLAVSANRNAVVQLVSSNLFGQNAPAIAAAEAHYEQMWAQDVVAMLGYHGEASAVAAALPTWATALETLPGQLAGQVAGLVSGGPGSAASALSQLGSANPAATQLPGVLGNIEQGVVNLINAPTEFLFGIPLINLGPAVTLGGNGQTGVVPLSTYLGTEALANASVGAGSPATLLVDTGSTGLVIPFQRVGGIFGLLQLGLPITGGISGYSGGLDYAYLTYNTTVNFGGGLITAKTPVDVELFAWPTSLSSALNNGFSFQNFFAADGASGVLGIGPNSGGPGPSIATQALPGSFGQGVLINETNPANAYLQFGPQPTLAGLTPVPLNGAPITNLDVRINAGPAQTVLSEIDSGGVQGTIPFNAPTGAIISVYAPGTNTLLYQYTNGVDYSPSQYSGVMNTGALIFQNNPVYISYTPTNQGQTVVYVP